MKVIFQYFIYIIRKSENLYLQNNAKLAYTPPQFIFSPRPRYGSTVAPDTRKDQLP